MWEAPSPKENAGWISRPAWSADGSQLAAGAGDGSTFIWHFTPGAGVPHEDRPPVRLDAQPVIVQCVAFDPTGQTLACGMEDGALVVWNIATQRQTYSVRVHSDYINDVAFNHDGRQIATAGRDGTVRRWDAATGAVLQTYVGPVEWLYATAFDAQNDIFAGGASQLRRWKYRADDSPLTVAAAASTRPAIEPFGHSPDGRLSVRVAADGSVRCYDGYTVAWSSELGSLPPTCAAFYPDGRRVVVGCADGTVQILSAANGHPLLRLDDAGDAAITSVAWDDDGRILRATNADRRSFAWRAAARPHGIS